MSDAPERIYTLPEDWTVFPHHGEYVIASAWRGCFHTAVERRQATDNHAAPRHLGMARREI
jgi:hypothetical protein